MIEKFFIGFCAGALIGLLSIIVVGLLITMDYYLGTVPSFLISVLIVCILGGIGNVFSSNEKNNG